MKNILLIVSIIFCFANSACSKKSGNGTIQTNHPPIASLVVTVKSASPFTIEFKVTASDEDNDPLTYTWDFGDGTTKTGSATETHNYADNKTFTAKVVVTDGKSQAV